MAPFQQYLVFAFNHLTVIIETIFALIVGTTIFWLVSNLKREEHPASLEKQQIDEIEAALRRVLDQTAPPLTTAAQAAQLIKDDDFELDTALESLELPGATEDEKEEDSKESKVLPSPDQGELDRLKAEGEAKNQKVTELQGAMAKLQGELEAAKALHSQLSSQVGEPSNSSDQNSREQLDQLSRKVKELEAKLAEYEIIEDDIANLSLYKEENARLKNELNKIDRTKGSATTEISEAIETKAPASTPAAFPIETSTNTTPSEPASAQALAPAAASATAAASAVSQEEGEHKLLEEFENFMKGAGT